VADPDGRELIMSCGAALLNLRIAMQHFGYLGEVELFPDANNPDLLARVRLGFQAENEVEDNLLFHAIVRRRTNRQRFLDDPLPEALLEVLQAAAAREGTWLHLIGDNEKRFAVADLVAEADQIQWSNQAFRHELAAWIHPNRSVSRDGIPGYAQGISDLLSYAGPLVVRTFDMGAGQAVKDRDIAVYSPVLAVLGTDEDTPHDWMAAGQALGKVLLRARVEDVWASFLNQPIEVAELRFCLRDVLERTGYPQVLLRLGFGSEVRPTPRRSVHEVLVQEAHAVKLSLPPSTTDLPKRKWSDTSDGAGF
jgi:hypothetical protein